MSTKNFRFATADIESKNWIEFLLLGYFDGEIYREFTSVKSFLKFLDKRNNEGLKIYFHYGGGFDFLFLYNEFFNSGFNVLSIVERAGHFIAIHVKGENVRSLWFCDSYAILPSSLKNLTISFNVKHKKLLDVNVEKFRKVNSKLKKYLEFDCKGLYEVIDTFHKSEFVNSDLKFTIGSQALNKFMTEYVPSKLSNMRLEHEDDFRKKFYHGGRVEIYKGYGENLKVYDVNSLYPFAMLEPMPCGEMFKTRVYQKNCVGFYSVIVKSTPDFYIPPFPYKTKKLYYINEPVKCFLSSAEIEHLRKTYAIKFEIEWGWYFKKKEYLFNDFVLDLYEKKKNNSDNAVGMISKLFLNSLYGKLGQSTWKQVIKRSQFITEENRKYGISEFDIERGLYIVTERKKLTFILVYLAAYITNLARLNHWKMMQDFDEKNMYYCDTDSFITSSNMDEKISDKIGDVKKISDDCKGVFLLPKTYALKDFDGKEKIIAKGFDASDWRFKDFKDALRGKILKVTNEKILKFKELKRRKNKIFNDKGEYLKTVIVEKEISSKYDKRKIVFDKDFVYNTIAFKGEDVLLTK